MEWGESDGGRVAARSTRRAEVGADGHVLADELIRLLTGRAHEGSIAHGLAVRGSAAMVGVELASPGASPIFIRHVSPDRLTLESTAAGAAAPHVATWRFDAGEDRLTVAAAWTDGVEAASTGRARLEPVFDVVRGVAQVLDASARRGRSTDEMIALVNALSAPCVLTDASGTVLAASADARSRLDAQAEAARTTPSTVRDASWRRIDLGIGAGPSKRLLVWEHRDAAAAASASVAMDRFCVEHGLTRAERDVVEALAEGQRPRAIADLLNRSAETVRTQLRSVRDKTGAGGNVAILSGLKSVEGGSGRREGDRA